MIRDEFIKKQNEEKLTPKEIAGIRQMGERAYYTSSLPRITALLKSFNLLALILLIMAVALIAVDVYTIIVTHKIGGGFGEWFSIILPFILLLVASVWYFIVRKSYLNRFKRYQQKIKSISRNEMLKQQKIYDKINK